MLFLIWSQKAPDAVTLRVKALTGGTDELISRVSQFHAAVGAGSNRRECVFEGLNISEISH
jgi:hypothetical protein